MAISTIKCHDVTVYRDYNENTQIITGTDVKLADIYDLMPAGRTIVSIGKVWAYGDIGNDYEGTVSLAADSRSVIYHSKANNGVIRLRYWVTYR